MSDGILKLSDHRPKKEPADDLPLWEAREMHLVICPGLSWDEWVEKWNSLDQTARLINFWLGDALVYAQANFPDDRWSQVVDPKYIHQQKGALWVASRIPPAERREGLSWSSHREVAGLNPEERNAILDLALKSEWGAREIAEEIRRRHPEKRRAAPAEKFHVEPAAPIVANEAEHQPRGGPEPESIANADPQATPAASASADAGGRTVGSIPATGAADSERRVPRYDPPAADLDAPTTAAEAAELLETLPAGALPDQIEVAIQLILAERVLLLGVLEAARRATEAYDLPELAAAIAGLEA